MSKNLSYLAGRKGAENTLFEKLSDVSFSDGRVDYNDLNRLRDEYLFGNANIYGAVTFYDFLKPENRNKGVYICNGTACLTAGTQESLKKKLTEHFAHDDIGEMCCLGRCHENNAFHLNGKNYSGKDLNQLVHIISESKTSSESYHVHHLGQKILTTTISNLEEYYELLKKMYQGTKEHVLEQIRESGLRGRGGAGFPAFIKYDACSKAKGEKKFIVCNADEGDPGAYSDRYIMEHRAHHLLLGMMIAGYASDADTGIIYIRAEYPESVKSILEAIEDVKTIVTTLNIPEANNFKFKVIKAQGAYICGEETALLSSIEGQRPEVRVRPPFPVEEGLFNCPTVVNNVETLACLPFILRYGGSSFKTIGTEKSSGTKLISLDGCFNQPGICEVEMGTPLAEVIYRLGGGFRLPVKALHIGGPLGGLVPVEKINDLTVDFESFSQNGFLLGHASVVCIPESFPMIRYIKHLFDFTAHESCGKCFPCRLGSVRGSEILQQAINTNYKIPEVLMDDLLHTLEKGSLCALGGGLPLPVRNALKYFSKELDPYFHTLKEI